MKKILKSIGVIISIVCIAFTAFFIYSYASGNIGPITTLEAFIVQQTNNIQTSQQNEQSSTVSMLSKEFGLTTTEAGQVINIVEQLGVDTSNAAVMSNFIAKNANNTAEIKGIVAALQAGQITELQAKTQLTSILNL